MQENKTFSIETESSGYITLQAPNRNAAVNAARAMGHRVLSATVVETE